MIGHIKKYGFKILLIVLKRILSNLFACFFMMKNLLIELFSSDYILVTSSVKPLYSNWGDDVSVILARFMSSRRVLASELCINIRRKKTCLCIGRIITWMTREDSYIWGSGVVYPDKEISAIPIKVLAVRGPLTRKYLLSQGIACPDIYGDPALLFPRYYKPICKKKYKLGVVPHFRDKHNKVFKKLTFNEDVVFIDVQDVRDWHTFIDKINMCESIVSSSLHGIIISDAYGVQNCWVEFFNGEQKRFAFQDYFLSVSKNISKPEIVDFSTSFSDMILFTEEWKKPQIDLERLISVCPFNLM